MTKILYPSDADYVLDGVLTLTEVAFMWDKDKKTVQVRLWKGDLHGRQSHTGSVWLITRSSCIKVWGQPHNELPEWRFTD